MLHLQEVKNFYELRNQLSTAVEGQAKTKTAASLLNAATPPQPSPRKNGINLFCENRIYSSALYNQASNQYAETCDLFTKVRTALSQFS